MSVLDANGLGSSVEELKGAQKVRFAKVYSISNRLKGGCQGLTVSQSNFAAELLFIATLCFAKLSIILFLNLITRQRSHRLLGNALGAFIIVWSAIEFIAVGFTCEVPATWNFFDSKCYDRVGYQTLLENRFTDMCRQLFGTFLV